MPEVGKAAINPDLEKERQKCTFDVEEFARYWTGGQAKLDEKRARGESKMKAAQTSSFFDGFFMDFFRGFLLK